jgi:predicted methyltransferase
VIDVRSLLLAALLAATAACRAEASPTAAEASAYDRYRRPDLLVSALGLEGCERVADIGAGAGYLTIPIAHALGSCGRVVATDIDANALDRLRARIHGDASLRAIEPRLVAPNDPGLGGERFHLILLAEVDHLLPDRADYLRRLRAHLDEHGRIAISNKRWDQDALVRDARAALLAGPLSSEAAPSLPHSLPGHFLLFFGASPSP